MIMLVKAIRSFCALSGALLVGLFQAQAETFRVVAAAQDSVPKYILENGTMSGVCTDIYHALNIELAGEGIEIVIPGETTPIKRIYAGLQSGRFDIYCGAGRNAERDRIFGFSEKPLYPVANILVTHRSETENPHDFAAMADTGKVIGALHGTATTRFLQREMESFPHGRVNDSFKDVETGLEAIHEGRIGFFFYHDLGLLYQLLKSDLNLKPLSIKFRKFHQYMAYSPRLDYGVIEKIEAALARLHLNGGLAESVARYRVN